MCISLRISVFFNSKEWKQLAKSRGPVLIFLTSIPVPGTAAAGGKFFIHKTK